MAPKVAPGEGRADAGGGRANGLMGETGGGQEDLWFAIGVEVVGPDKNGFVDDLSATTSFSVLSVLAVRPIGSDTVVRLRSVLPEVVNRSVRGGPDFRKCQTTKIPKAMYPLNPNIVHQSERIRETKPSGVGTAFSVADIFPQRFNSNTIGREQSSKIWAKLIYLSKIVNHERMKGNGSKIYLVWVWEGAHSHTQRNNNMMLK